MLVIRLGFRFVRPSHARAFDAKLLEQDKNSFVHEFIPRHVEGVGRKLHAAFIWSNGANHSGREGTPLSLNIRDQRIPAKAFGKLRMNRDVLRSQRRQIDVERSRAFLGNLEHMRDINFAQRNAGAVAHDLNLPVRL